MFNIVPETTIQDGQKANGPDDQNESGNRKHYVLLYD